jgi:predicted nucleic acid-binding protein
MHELSTSMHIKSWRGSSEDNTGRRGQPARQGIQNDRHQREDPIGQARIGGPVRKRKRQKACTVEGSPETDQTDTRERRSVRRFRSIRPRHGYPGLAGLLVDGDVASHPFIVGELACESLKNRAVILSLLEALPMETVLDHEEVLSLIENHRLMGKGLGCADVDLPAPAVLSRLPLRTRDRKLRQVADVMHVRYPDDGG